MKRLIIGLIVGLLIGAASTAAAQSETVQATFSKFSFVVDGQVQSLESDPLVYQGTTYLPVRVVANMLGYDVTFRADERKIELQTAATNKQPQQERRHVGMEQTTISTDEWISFRDLGSYFKEKGGSFTLNRDDDLLEISISDKEYKIQFPIKGLEAGKAEPFPLIDQDGSITLMTDGVSWYILIKDLEDLNILD